jgi:TolB-like protein/Flp pilus assembly protein TadD
MGEVFRARDERLGREVAIKVLPAGFAADRERLKRFEREARATAALSHPNILAVHDVGTHEGVPYLVEELLEGESLKSRLERGRLEIGEATRIALEMAKGLAFAHEKGIVHRDLKPGNVFLTRDGTVKILDFGLAKLVPTVPEDEVETATRGETATTALGGVIGTVAYMAPEQARGKPVDQRADVFAFGVVLYEMLAGQRPFRGATSTDVIAAILKDSPPPLPAEVPTALATIVGLCLAKEPAGRYARAGEVRSALDALQAGGSTSTARRAAPHTRRRWLLPAGLAALGALVAAVVALDVGGVRGRLLAGMAGAGVRAVAVLPVANLSGDPEQEYLSDGMTDALITDLSKIGALRVISRTSVMQYKRARKRLPEIARELGVDAVLEASVLREANRVRVTAQLVRASTEQSLWAESYERDFTSVLTIQRDVARAVARTVRVKIRPQEERNLARARPVNPETYEAYLKGMFLLNRATQSDREKGIAHFHDAVANDPADPLAYAGLALAYTQLAHSSEAREEDLQRASAAAQTALRLDDSLAEVVLAVGFAKGYYEWRWEEALGYIDRALDINPSLAMAYYHRAWYLLLFDRVQEAIENHRRAKELDPFNPLHVAWLGEIYRMNGQPEEAATECLRSIEMAPRFPPGHFILAMVYKDQGKYEDAVAALQKAAEASPAYRWALGPVYVSAGRRGDAVRLLDQLDQEKTTPWTAFWRVVNHANLGELDEALRWLDYEPHHAWLPWVRFLDWAEPLRRDPRFAARIERMNVPPPR